MFVCFFTVALRSVAACHQVYLWGCPDPTGSHLLGCPRPRECGGPRWGLEARLRSFQSQSSRPPFCRSSRAQTAGSCPRPAGKQLRIRLQQRTKGLYYHLEHVYTSQLKMSTAGWRELRGQIYVCICLTNKLLFFCHLFQVLSWEISQDKTWNS